ncbi:transcription initiation factor IID, 31kD subunit-domain-containing protein [Aspergillus cavernicola]|uniref:Transcription initiation factor IID, 31kD subunit-domain-containing protein n=1 Tax=Aspergillus cavernicola TaxID=176166 RepID=A0ABR4I971_9EURO
MASPNQTQVPPSTQPLTPPAEPSNNAQTTTSAPSQPTQPTTATATATQQTTTTPTPPSQPAQVPATSLKDPGKSRRPRDVRLIHMLLAAQGVTAYQERVPLQLLDFAYRYTSSVLQDAVHLTTEGYSGAGAENAGGSANRGPLEVNSVTLPALRLSIASRLHYQFQTGLPKEFLMDVAAERNRVALPGATRGFDAGGAAGKPAASSSVLMAGMRLPPERFCLTGSGWKMSEEWESEGEEEVVLGEGRESGAGTGGGEDKEGEGDEDEDEDGKMEDIFGDDAIMGEDGDDGDDGDKDMMDV